MKARIDGIPEMKIGTPVKWPCVEELAQGEIVGIENRAGKFFYSVEGETVRGLRVASSLRRASELVCIELVKDAGIRTQARAA